MNKRIFKFAIVLATLMALFVSVVGVSADKGTPPPPGGPSIAGGPLTGGPLSVGGPDAFGYTWTDTISGGVTYSWDEISGTGTALAVGDDTVSGAIPLPFTFSYYGANYSNIYVGSNGFLTVLAGQGAGCCDGLALPNAGSPNGIIAGYWADLFTAAGGTVYYETLGVAPNRRFVAEWTGVPYFWEAGSATFEIKLFEGSNKIEVHYVGASVYTTRTASLGIENTTGTVGLNYGQGNIGVISGAILYTPVPHVGLSTTSLNFGNQLVGTTSAPLGVVVTNTGSAPLNIAYLSWSGDFDYPSPDTCTGASIAPLGTCTFSYTFSPTVLGYQSATVSIVSNASTSPDLVAMDGTGVSIPAGLNLIVNPGYDNFVTAPKAWLYSVVNVPLSSLRDCGYYISPSCSLKLAASRSTAIVTQTVTFPGLGGQSFIWGLSSAAYNVPAGGSYKVEIALFNRFNRVMYTNTLYFSNGAHGWETLNGTFTAPAAFNKMRYRIYFQKSAGWAWFEDAFLIQLP